MNTMDGKDTAVRIVVRVGFCPLNILYRRAAQ